MVIALFVLIMFFIISMISNKKINSLAYTVYILSMFFMLAAALLYFVKFANYRFPIKIDYMMYLLMSSFTMSVYEISVIYNLGVVCIMLANIILLRDLCKLSAAKVICLTLPVIIYFVFNLPQVCRELYLYETIYGAYGIIKFLRYAVEAFIYVYMLIPLCVYVKKYRTTRLEKNEKSIILNMCSLVIIDAFMVVFFFWGVFSPISNVNISLFKLPVKSIEINNFTMIPLSVLIILIVVLSLVVISAPKLRNTLAKQKTISRNMRYFNKSNYMISHTYKNKFVLINKLGKFAQTYDDDIPAELGDIIKQIIEVSEAAYTDIERMSSVMKPIYLIESDVNVLDCINSAVQSAKISDNIKLSMNIEIPSNITISGDAEHLKEAFLNLISNSVDALEGRSDPTIIIKLYECEKHLFIEIYDNGCGIEKKDIKFLFNSFFSTKTGGGNCGMGLTYVKKVINAHMGDIYVKSVKNSYTMFRIVFPINDEVNE